MEAIKNDMFYVNCCYTVVLELFQKLYIQNLQLVQNSESQPVTDEAAIESVTDKIEGFLDNIKRGN